MVYRDARKRFVGSAVDLIAPAAEMAFNNFAHSDKAVLLIDGWWDGGNGRYILYVRDNALWLIRMLAPGGVPAPGAAVRVVSRLFPGAWPRSYAYTAWPAQFAWRS